MDKSVDKRFDLGSHQYIFNVEPIDPPFGRWEFEAKVVRGVYRRADGTNEEADFPITAYMGHDEHEAFDKAQAALIKWCKMKRIIPPS